LEEIPQAFGKGKKSRTKRSSSKKSKRPISLCGVGKTGSPKGDYSSDSHNSSNGTVVDLSTGGKRGPVHC
jgi:hypothetical protein